MTPHHGVRAPVGTSASGSPKSGWVWKVVAPILGSVSFGIAGAAIGDKIDPYGFIISNGAVNGAVAGMATGIGAGLVVGWLADRHYVRIEILPRP